MAKLEIGSDTVREICKYLVITQDSFEEDSERFADAARRLRAGEKVLGWDDGAFGALDAKKQSQDAADRAKKVAELIAMLTSGEKKGL